MAPKYKLTYFDLTGLGEPLRFLLSYGGLEFEDIRIQHADWPALKASTPNGQLPLLEVDGKVLYQSMAIARYLGNVVGLVGKTPLENWEIDAAIDTVTDLRLKFVPWFFEKDPVKKAALADALKNEIVPQFLSKLDAQVKKNNGYLALGKLTWADIVFVGVDDYINVMYEKEFGKALFAGYPNLEAFRSKIRSIPKIQAWIAKRPGN